MRKQGPGIRAKLALALAGVLLVGTVSFGVAYARIERGTILEVERGHLEHMARLVGPRLAGADTTATLQASVAALQQELREARDTPHEVVVRDDGGAVLAVSHPRRLSGEAGSDSGSVLPSPLRVELPVQFERLRDGARQVETGRLVVYESLTGLEPVFQRSLRRHLLFAGGLIGLVLVAAGLAADGLVVRPVRELAALTDGIAKGGSWGPVAPARRRSDEIGRLGDRLAELSRRLLDSVRDERYGSASLVATRARQELEEPLRRIAMQLAVLQELLPSRSEGSRALEAIAGELDRADEVLRRLVIPRQAPTR